MREETYDISGMHCAACSARWSGLHASSPAWSEAM